MVTRAMVQVGYITRFGIFAIYTYIIYVWPYGQFRPSGRGSRDVRFRLDYIRYTYTIDIRDRDYVNGIGNCSREQYITYAHSVL